MLSSCCRVRKFNTFQFCCSKTDVFILFGKLIDWTASAVQRAMPIEPLSKEFAYFSAPDEQVYWFLIICSLSESSELSGVRSPYDALGRVRYAAVYTQPITLSTSHMCDDCTAILATVTRHRTLCSRTLRPAASVESSKLLWACSPRIR